MAAAAELGQGPGSMMVPHTITNYAIFNGVNSPLHACPWAIDPAQ